MQTVKAISTESYTVSRNGERGGKMNGKRPYMDYPQYRAARRLVHECCNYDNGNCILLDNGEPCVCVQSISYSLMCRWFIAAVLPLDGKLEAALLHRADRKRCTECGGYFLPNPTGGNTARLRRTHESRASAEKILFFYAFRL